MRSNLSWTHYRMILNVEDKKARAFYYQRLLSSQDKVKYLLFISKFSAWVKEALRINCYNSIIK